MDGIHCLMNQVIVKQRKGAGGVAGGAFFSCTLNTRERKQCGFLVWLPQVLTVALILNPNPNPRPNPSPNPDVYPTLTFALSPTLTLTLTGCNSDETRRSLPLVRRGDAKVYIQDLDHP